MSVKDDWGGTVDICVPCAMGRHASWEMVKFI